MKTVTLRLEDDLHKQLKMYSVKHEISIQELLVSLVEKLVSDTNIED